MASSVVLGRHNWLRSTALPVEAKHKVEDLSFEGPFLERTGEVFSLIKKNKQMARSLGVLHLVPAHSSRGLSFANLGRLIRRTTIILAYLGSCILFPNSLFHSRVTPNATILVDLDRLTNPFHPRKQLNLSGIYFLTREMFLRYDDKLVHLLFCLGRYSVRWMVIVKFGHCQVWL